MIAVLIESALDAILLRQEVPGVTSIALGSAQAQPDARTRKMLEAAEAVLVALDSDAPGAEAAWRLCGNARNTHRLPVPPKYGKDIGEAHRNGMPLDAFVRIGAKRAKVSFLPDSVMNESEPQRAALCTANREAFAPTVVSGRKAGHAPRTEVTVDREVSFDYIRDAVEAERAVAKLLESGERIAVDIETAAIAKGERAALDPHRSRPRLLQAVVEGAVQVFDLDHVPLGTLQPLVRGEWCAHNGVFDFKHLCQHGLGPGVPTCTRLLDNALRNVNASLADSCKEHLGLELDKDAQTSDWSVAELSDAQLCYAAMDAMAARRLWQVLREQVCKRGRKDLAAVMLAAQPAVAQMELRGLGFDSDAHAALVQQWEQERHASEAALTDLVGAAINPNSHQQVEELLIRHLSQSQLSDWPRTPKGCLSLCEDDLAAYRNVPVVDAILGCKRWGKLRSSFAGKLAAQVNPITGRLHSSFLIAGATRTGRFTSSRPCVHQMPRDREFRRLFVAASGHRLVRADYGQIQLRVAALLSGDARLCAAFERGLDVHRQTAATLLGKELSEVTGEERTLAKAIGFGMLFGMGANGLRRYAMSSYGVPLSEGEAGRMIDRFFDAYPDLYRWRMNRVDEARSTGCVSTPLGRVRNFAFDGDDKLYTASMNTPIQGGEGEVMLAALGAIPALLAPHGAYLVNCVHDELLVECPADSVEPVQAAVREGMEAGMRRLFPNAPTDGLVDVAHGLTWADAK